MKKIIIIIRGKTGGGKTTLVNRVSDEFGFDKLIIDEIKNTVPRDDSWVENLFKKAGSIVDGKLKNGKNVVVEEAFLDGKNFDDFFGMIDSVDEHEVYCVRLECSEGESVKRKTDLSAQKVAGQFRRTTDAIDNLKEFVINTEDKSKEDVFKEFVKLRIM